MINLAAILGRVGEDSGNLGRVDWPGGRIDPWVINGGAVASELNKVGCEAGIIKA